MKSLFFMDELRCEEILKKHGIKPTANRIVIVKALECEMNPMSMTELSFYIKTIDKSNIFRALSLFRENHLVHTIEDGQGETKYELCLSHDVDDDDDEHMHFYCTRCHKTFCLYDIPIPAVSLPHGYKMDSCNFVVKGLCPKCSQKF